MKTFEIYESPIKESTIIRIGYLGENQCECCGKLIKDSDKTYWFHASTDWVAVPYNTTNEELELNDMESQGIFQVGSECANQFPKGFIGILWRVK